MESTVAITFSDNNNNNNSQQLDQFVRDCYTKQLFTDCILYCRNQPNPREISDSLWLKSTESNLPYSEFKCHRLILSAYSDFFKHYFLNTIEPKYNVKPSSISASLFLDTDSNTLKNILQLIYNGQVEILQAEFEKFSNFATKLGLKQFVPNRSQTMGDQSTSVDLLLKRSSTMLNRQDYSMGSSLQQPTKKIKSHHYQHHQSKSSNNTKPQSSGGQQRASLTHDFIDFFGECPEELKGTECTSCQTNSAKESTINEAKNNGGNSLTGIEQIATSTMTSTASKRAVPSPVLGALPQQPPPPPSSSLTEGNIGPVVASPPPPPPLPPNSARKNSEMYVCPVCSKQYEYKISLNKHIKNNHPNV